MVKAQKQEVKADQLIPTINTVAEVSPVVCVCSNNRKSINRLFWGILLLLSMMCAPVMAQMGQVIPQAPFECGEKLVYNIYYNWGFIWKKAATGELHIDNAMYKDKLRYKMTLACRTLSFVDKIMPVRDTLIAHTTHGLRPLHYSKITNEGKFSGQDHVAYKYHGGRTAGEITLVRKNRPNHDTVVWSDKQPYDMLSVFYYLRSLDLEKMPMYSVIDVPIYTGRRLITMRVKYLGRTLVKLHNKKQYPAFRMNLSFLNDKNLDDQDHPIEVWLSDDDRKIPLKLEGKLPLGSLQAEFSEDESRE